jgi:hypothetical protein
MNGSTVKCLRTQSRRGRAYDNAYARWYDALHLGWDNEACDNRHNLRDGFLYRLSSTMIWTMFGTV